MPRVNCCYNEVPSNLYALVDFEPPYCPHPDPFPLVWNKQSGSWKTDGATGGVSAELTCGVDGSGHPQFVLSVEGLCEGTEIRFENPSCDPLAMTGCVFPLDGQECCGYGGDTEFCGIISDKFIPASHRPRVYPCDPSMPCCTGGPGGGGGSGGSGPGGGGDGGNGGCGGGGVCFPGPGTPRQTSDKPVRYSTGELLLRASDLSAGGFGEPWGHTRGYVHRLGAAQTFGQGPYWLVEEWPHLVLSPTGTVAVMGQADSALWFEPDGSGGYIAQLGIRHTLTFDGGTQLFSLAAPDGSVTVFDDEGLFLRRTSPGGQLIEVTSFHANNWNPLTVDRSVTIGGVTTTERLEYEYTTVSADVALSRVTLRRKVGAGSWGDVERASYTYYVSDGTFGLAGDLKTVTTEVWDGSSWVSTGVTLYRYYTASSQAHLLKYVVNPASYARLAADPGVSDPLTASLPRPSPS